MSVFGQTVTAIHIGLVIFNAATILVVFWLAKNLFGPLAGLASAAAYAIMSLASSMQGLSANAEHFVVLPALVGVALAARPVERRPLPVVFIAALLLGLAFVIKQHGIFFAVFGAAYLLSPRLFLRPASSSHLLWFALSSGTSASLRNSGSGRSPTPTNTPRLFRCLWAGRYSGNELHRWSPRQF
jgi:4-amino-4-deoxy-L-arabinose transferase-like glycosyltransferase